MASSGIENNLAIQINDRRLHIVYSMGSSDGEQQELKVIFY